MQKWYAVFGWLWSLPLTMTAFVLFLLVPVLCGQLRWRKRQGQLLPFFGFVVELEVVEGGWLERLVFKKWAGVNYAGIIVYRADYADSVRTLVHERRHAWQCFVFGVFQPILYWGHCLFIFLFQWKRHAYLDNWFERDARRAAGQPVEILPEEWFEGPDDRWPWW